MPWVRIDESMPDHPRTLALMGSGRNAGADFGFLVAMICYSSRVGSDGFVPQSALVRCASWRTDSRQVGRTAARLASVGYLEPANIRGQVGWQIHKFSEYQRTKDERDKLGKVRAEAGAKGGRTTAANAASKRSSKRLQQTSSNGSSTDIQTETVQGLVLPDQTRPCTSERLERSDAREIVDDAGAVADSRQQAESGQERTGQLASVAEIARATVGRLTQQPGGFDPCDSEAAEA